MVGIDINGDGLADAMMHVAQPGPWEATMVSGDTNGDGIVDAIMPAVASAKPGVPPAAQGP